MVPVPANQICDVVGCNLPATNFHPYAGFCCRTHQKEAQDRFNSVKQLNLYEEFAAIKLQQEKDKQLNNERNTGRYPL
jgi:hypothetical protein